MPFVDDMPAPDHADYSDWIAIRARGRTAHLTRVAARTGLPTGLALALVAALGQLAAGNASLTSLTLETWFFTSGAVILTVVAGWAEWRWLEREFTRPPR